MINQKFNKLIEHISLKIRINEIPRELHPTYRANFGEPEELAKDIFKYSDYSAKQEHEEQLNFHSYFDQNPQLLQLNEFEDLIEILILNQNNYKKINEYENKTEKLSKIIKKFIVYLYQTEQKIIFNENELEKYASELEAFFRDDEIIITSIHPLDGFYSNVERIELEKGLFIQRMSLNEREKLISGYFLHSRLNIIDILTNEYWLFNEYLLKSRGINDSAIFTEKKFLTFLRIFKSGKVRMRHYKLETNYWTSDFVFGGLISHSDSFVVDNGNYIIQKEETEQFTDLWRKYQEIDFSQDGALNIAIKRYNDSFVRRDVEDRIIDLMIAFEAFFLKKGEKMELTFKLALRTAIFLGGGDRENLFEFMKKAYSTRSDIVHGIKPINKIKVKKGINSKESDEYTPQEFLNKLEEILRECLLKYIREYKGYKIEKLINSIDKKILI